MKQSWHSAHLREGIAQQLPQRAALLPIHTPRVAPFLLRFFGQTLDQGGVPRDGVGAPPRQLMHEGIGKQRIPERRGLDPRDVANLNGAGIGQDDPVLRTAVRRDEGLNLPRLAGREIRREDAQAERILRQLIHEAIAELGHGLQLRQHGAHPGEVPVMGAERLIQGRQIQPIEDAGLVAVLGQDGDGRLTEERERLVDHFDITTGHGLSPPSADDRNEGFAPARRRCGRGVVIEAAVLRHELEEVRRGEGGPLRRWQDAHPQIEEQDRVAFVAGVHVKLPRCTVLASQVRLAVAMLDRSSRARSVWRIAVWRRQLLDRAPNHPMMLRRLAGQVKTAVGWTIALSRMVSGSTTRWTEKIALHGSAQTSLAAVTDTRLRPWMRGLSE